jgi:hypothetical protein
MGEYEGQVFLHARTIISAVSAATESEHTDSIKWIDKYPHSASHARRHRRDPRRRKARAYETHLFRFFLTFLWLTPLGHRRHLCTFSTSAAALVLLRVTENDSGEDGDGDGVTFGVPFATSPASRPRSAR